MNYVDHLNLFGVEAKEIPCIKGKGAPNTSTEGAVGCFYMNIDTGDVYKCISVEHGVYTWSVNGESVTTYFGTPYSSAEKIVPLNAGNTVRMYLFSVNDGYDAVVTGSGAVDNQEYEDFTYTESTVDKRGYHPEKIVRMHIEKGVTSIGDYFMYKAFNLKHLSFADSKAVTHLGAYAFAYTSIGGEYDFSGLTDTELIAPFMHCPKLQGVTFNSGEVCTYKIENNHELGWSYSNMTDMTIELTNAYQVNGQYYACDGYALHLVHPAGNESTSIHQKVKLPAYTPEVSKIKLSVSACGTFGNKSAYMQLVFYAEDGKTALTPEDAPSDTRVWFKTSEDWQEYNSELTIPDGAASVRAYIYYAFKGRASDCYVDNVSLTVDGGENLFADDSSFNTVPDETKLVVTEQLFADKSTITSIAEKSFQMCLALEYVHGLANVILIDNAAFQYCTNLKNIDADPDIVKLGRWVFILTPNDAVIKDTNMCLSEIAWKYREVRKDDDGEYIASDLPANPDGTIALPVCFSQNEWTSEQLKAIRDVKGESIQMPIPESDNQGTEFYMHWGAFPWPDAKMAKTYASFIANGQPASGCCGIFSLYHIYNILHPNSQYDTFYDWMMRAVVPNKITVTKSLHDALESSGYLSSSTTCNPEVPYEVGSEITARDLPMALDADSETWGNEGTSFWGCCEAMGWTATEWLLTDTDEETEDNKLTGKQAKEKILENLTANKPVEMEIVGAGGGAHGMHAVVAIGYDAATDKLLIIDSTGGFDADVVPLSYWCSFESLITPHEASAIWTFDFGEVITLRNVDKKLGDVETALDAILDMQKFLIGDIETTIDGIISDQEDFIGGN